MKGSAGPGEECAAAAVVVQRRRAVAAEHEGAGNAWTGQSF